MRRSVDDVLKDLREQALKLDKNATVFYLCGFYEIRTTSGGLCTDSAKEARRFIAKLTHGAK